MDHKMHCYHFFPFVTFCLQLSKHKRFICFAFSLNLQLLKASKDCRLKHVTSNKLRDDKTYSSFVSRFLNTRNAVKNVHSRSNLTFFIFTLKFS